MNLARYIADQLRRVNQDEDGQALAFTSVVILTMFFYLALTVNIGLFVGRRVDAQTNADTIALSGASWQARGLNLITALNNINAFFARSLEFEHRQVEALLAAEATMLAAVAASAGAIPVDTDLTQSVIDQTTEANAESAFYSSSSASTNLGINNLQHAIAYFYVPLAVIADTFAYAGPGLSAAEIGGAVPWGEPFFGGNIPLPIAGGIPLARERISEADTATLTNPVQRMALNPTFYPDYLFTLSGAYDEFDGLSAPLLPSVFQKDSVIFDGYLAIAQARPYVPFYIAQGRDETLLRGTPSDLAGFRLNWDAQLMPISADNLLLGIIPVVGPGIAGLTTDFALTH